MAERATAPAKRFGIPALELDRAAEALDRLVEGLLSHRDHSLGVPSHWILGGQVKRFSQILLSARVIVHLGADVGAAHIGLGQSRVDAKGVVQDLLGPAVEADPPE